MRASPSVITYNGAPEVVAVNTAGHVKATYFTGGTFIAPADGGGGFATNGHLATNLDHGNLEVYGLSSTGHLVESYYGNSWNGPEDIGAGLAAL